MTNNTEQVSGQKKKEGFPFNLNKSINKKAPSWQVLKIDPQNC